MNETGAHVSIVEFAETHYKTAAFVTHGTRCGKANCKCARTNYRHGPYAYLFWYEHGHARRRYVPKDQVPAVRAIIERRQAERREWRAMLAESREQLRFIRWYLRQLRRERDGQ